LKRERLELKLGLVNTYRQALAMLIVLKHNMDSSA